MGHAVGLLGVGRIRDLTLLAGAFDCFSQGSALQDAEVEYLQDHALRTSVLARTIQEDCEPSRADDAATAGLLHVVGSLVMACRLPDAFAEVRSRRGDVPRARLAYPARGLRVHPSEMACVLLDLWGIPGEIVEGVTWYDQPGVVPHDDVEVVDAVHIASALASEVSGAHRRATGYDTRLDLTHVSKLGLERWLAAWRGSAQGLA